ncbi:MAG: hypothetical protein B7Z29_09260 [Hyphomicrobium sp. 12-62-95]|nr:MAG: hypothetical protein B7Z29_09260 [Hyphomicrobium sp. 12-62-95]
MASASDRQTLAFRWSTYDNVLRYDLLAAAGIQVDLLREPLNGWKLLSGRKRIELTGGGRILTCMDRHLLLRIAFKTRHQPDTIGDALRHCTSLDRLEEPATTASALALVDKH